MALLVLLTGCTAPEARTARKFLGCLADRDLSCLRRYHAPLVARLRAWASAIRLDPLRVGPYARHAMRDADNPFWTIVPVSCAQRVANEEVAKESLGDLGSCRCESGTTTVLAPEEERYRTFEPQRDKAAAVHPALEILAARATAEARRVRNLWTVACRCGDRRVQVALLDLAGRDPPIRVFKMTGICGDPDLVALREAVAVTERLLRGDLGAPAVPPPAAAPTGTNGGTPGPSAPPSDGASRPR
jgi:hypothetical protein